MMNQDKLLAYFQLTRLDRPVGIYLVLWPALWGLWLAAEHNPSLLHLIVFILGAVVMRSAGCVINDYADRDWDGAVERTCQRPLATGRITPKEALIFFGLLCLVGFGLVLLLNPLTILLSFGAAFLAALYPFMKRYTYWPQIFLGAAFAWAIPMAFAVEQNALPIELWLIYATTLVWALVYDTAYAITDKADDLKVGIKSTAILFGERVNQMIGLFQAIMLLGLLVIGWAFELGGCYFLSLVGVLALFIYHQQQLAKQDPQIAFQVFLHNHWIGLVVLIGLILDKNC